MENSSQITRSVVETVFDKDLPQSCTQEVNYHNTQLSKFESERKTKLCELEKSKQDIIQEKGVRRKIYNYERFRRSILKEERERYKRNRKLGQQTSNISCSVPHSPNCDDLHSQSKNTPKRKFKCSCCLSSIMC